MTFVDGIGLTLGDIGYDLIVLTPTRATLTTRVCVRGLPIVIHRCTLLMDFVILLMRQFDAIFDMEWMTRHKALIGCLKKKVWLASHAMKE